MIVISKLKHSIKLKGITPLIKIMSLYSSIKNLEIPIKQSKNDKAKYRIVKLLKNDLDCLLINDEEADKSACSMNVKVGNLEDPIEY